MSEKIDYAFLSQLEGGSKTTGYVPAAGVSKSGVTVATGFDLGQRNEADLKALGLPSSLIAKLKPYLGKKSKDAQDALAKAPLTITASEAAAIDKAVKKSHVRSADGYRVDIVSIRYQPRCARSEILEGGKSAGLEGVHRYLK